jgi:hypothetical protein
LDKLRLRHKRRRQQEVRVQLLRHRRIRLQRSSRLLRTWRPDNKHLQRTCRRGSNRHLRQENPDNLQPQANLACQAQQPVLAQSVQRVLLQPL